MGGWISVGVSGSSEAGTQALSNLKKGASEAPHSLRCLEIAQQTERVVVSLPPLTPPRIPIKYFGGLNLFRKEEQLYVPQSEGRGIKGRFICQFLQVTAITFNGGIKCFIFLAPPRIPSAATGANCQGVRE